MDSKLPQERKSGTHRHLQGIVLSWSLVLSFSLQAAPEGAILVRSLIPDLEERMPYAGKDNFTGHPVPGYDGPHCWLHPAAAHALASAVREATQRGLTLEIYDCYRPRAAVEAFVAWSHNPDQGTKAHFYPRVSKDTLFTSGYIARESTHRTGLSIDLGFKGLHFGTPFDFFDPQSGLHGAVSERASRNRRQLRDLMMRHGFNPYEPEWWHYTLRFEPQAPALEGDIPP